MDTRLPLTLSALSLLAVGCGAAAQPALIERATAESLAQRTSVLADQLDAGDGCAAAETRDALLDATDAAMSAGDLPEAVAATIIRTTRAAVAEVPCTPPAPADDDHDAEARSKGEPKGKAKGRSKGKDD